MLLYSWFTHILLAGSPYFHIVWFPLMWHMWVEHADLIGSKGNSAYGSKQWHKQNLSTQLDSTPSSSVNSSKEVEALYRGIHMLLSWKCGVCGIGPNLKVIVPSNHHFSCPSLYRPCYLAACTGVSLIWQTFYIMKKPQDMSLHI